MLMIRHAIGSRLFFQTDIYEVKEKGNRWEISVRMDDGTASNILSFQEELNIFDTKENEKTWYYSSDALISFDSNEKRLVILADHKTVYPIN